MAIIREWQSGFEARSAKEFDGGYFSDSTTARTGTYSNAMNPGYPSAAQWYFYKNTSLSRQKRVGFAWRYISIVSNSGSIAEINSATGTHAQIRTIPGTDDLALYVLGVQQDVTTNSPLYADTWFHIGMDVKVDSSSGWAYIYLNGTEILSYSGDTGNDDIFRVYFGNTVQGIGAYTSWYYDDCYIDDLTGEGSPINVPILRFPWLALNGNGNYSQWIGSDGDSTDNYALLDERPPSESDYVYVSGTNYLDSYALTSYTIEAGQQVHAVIPLVYSQRYGIGEELSIGTRYSGTNSIGTNQDPGYGAYNYVWERQTGTPIGGLWNQDAIDNLELAIYSTGTF